MTDPMAARLGGFDATELRREFLSQGAFVILPDFLPPELTAQLVAAVAAVGRSVNRNYLPGHKQGGSVSRHAIDELAPVIANLYRSPALIEWLGQLAGERLHMSPDDDPHAYALYFYTRAGDHIGWHYDTSYYAGRRYTLLLGVIEESSCRLDYQLHTRNRGRNAVSGSVPCARSWREHGPRPKRLSRCCARCAAEWRARESSPRKSRSVFFPLSPRASYLRAASFFSHSCWCFAVSRPR